MKNYGKKIAALLMMVCVVAMLTACAGFGKKAAFAQYGQSLNSDNAYWNELTDASSRVSSSSDATTVKAVVQARIIPALTTIQANAKSRNAGITDSEIKALDDHYVACVDRLLEGFTYMLDGLNTNDMSKLNKGNAAITQANTELGDWVDGIDKFMKNNNIKDDGSIASVKQMIQ